MGDDGVNDASENLEGEGVVDSGLGCKDHHDTHTHDTHTRESVTRAKKRNAGVHLSFHCAPLTVRRKPTPARQCAPMAATKPYFT